MSHLRAPAAREDRRAGGRRGRPPARAVLPYPEIRMRPQLRRLAVLPPLAVALAACAAVLYTIRITGARPTLALWAVLAGSLAVTAVGVVIAAVAAERAARSVDGRLDALRRDTSRDAADLRALVEALRRGETPSVRAPRGTPAADADEFEQLAAELARAHDGAVAAVVQAAQLSSRADSEQKLEVFLNLARRLQSLVHREISILDELENDIEDPDLLKGLFHIDHLATRIRRHAENLAVLGGAVSRRQWSNPVPMTEVLRSATAEVEQYTRVRLVPPVDGSLRGHAVADVIHLLAELVENATVFSAPHTQVLLRAGLVTSGLAVEVEDRGLGMPQAEQNKMNALLADPDQFSLAGLLADGRIGLFVVSQLARRHGIHVRLQTNIYGGVQAVLVLPQGLLGPAPGTAATMTPVAPQGTAVPTGGRSTAGAAGSRPTTATSLPDTAVAPGPWSTVAAADPWPATTPADPWPATTPADPWPATTPADPWPATTPADPHPAAVVPPPHTRPTHPSAPASEHPVPHEPRRPAPDGIPTERVLTPLPVRDTDTPRPTPAEARPGIRPTDRATLAENATRPPTPRVDAASAGSGRPTLPRRRAQEHLAPQLRGGPTPPVLQDADRFSGHDPGLMAAFRRGIGLAEALRESNASEPDLTDRHDGGAPAG
ncbi:ATP-binding protein [Streptomyces sp. NPDC001848]|uniref:ATP-binding protein n=1 Tax=Streptomyces sp. NPDC001848 TaxID=3364618 RepID=UPI0036CA48BB